VTTTPTPPTTDEQALLLARLHLDEAVTNLDLAINGPASPREPGVRAPRFRSFDDSDGDARSSNQAQRSPIGEGKLDDAAVAAETHDLRLDGCAVHPFSKDPFPPGVVHVHVHQDSCSSVVSTPEGKGSVGSPSGDPTETRTTGPFRTLTDRLEDLIRVDEILARAFPAVISGERIRVAVEITGALKWGAS
jgi:hypothetical protein